MKPLLQYSYSQKVLFGPTGRFDPWRLSWDKEYEHLAKPADAVSIDPQSAVTALAQGGLLRRVPIAVIGPREARVEDRSVAETLGHDIGRMGLQLLCGGKNGVMEAASKGCLEAGGLPIGLVPDEEWSAANSFVAIPLATGIGLARNAIIARAAEVLIAVGGGYGTLSEIAYGLQFGRLVLTLNDAPQVKGAIVCSTAEDAIERTCWRLLRLDRPLL